jgi:hypothetical protein
VTTVHKFSDEAPSTNEHIECKQRMWSPPPRHIVSSINIDILIFEKIDRSASYRNFWWEKNSGLDIVLSSRKS